MISQYIQHPAIAKDFSNYFNLYRKYQVDYDVSAILRGSPKHYHTKTAGRPFDERFSALTLLLDALFRSCGGANEMDDFVTQLHKALQDVIHQLKEGVFWQVCLEQAITSRSDLLEQQKQAGQLNQTEWNRDQMILRTLEEYRTELAQASVTAPDVAADRIRSGFQRQVQARKTQLLPHPASWTLHSAS